MLAASLVQTAVAGVLLVALLSLWLLATRRHRRRREGRAAEWQGADGRTALWTSGARCPHCGHHGGLLEVDDRELWFVCLACQRRHRREHRG